MQRTNGIPQRQVTAENRKTIITAMLQADIRAFGFTDEEMVPKYLLYEKYSNKELERVFFRFLQRQQMILSVRLRERENYQSLYSLRSPQGKTVEELIRV